MKKRASKSKAPARKRGAKTTTKAKSAAKPAGKKRTAKPASATRPAIGPGRREQATIEAAKYTPAPVQSAGWPAFRYPLL
jgi:hypothetical protein